MAAATRSSAAAAIVPSASSHHRSDPLDIPLIDGHLLAHLLLPRIISAIRLVSPQVYLDWTTGVANNISHSGNNGGGTSSRTDNNGGAQDDNVVTSQNNNNNNKTLVWKRILEGLLRTCLLLGSCHRIFNKSNNSSIILQTPAMHSLGMFLRPVTSGSSSSSSSRSTGRGNDNVSAIVPLSHRVSNCTCF